MKLGVIIGLNANEGIEEKIKKVHDMGFSSCQINCWETKFYTREMADRINSALNEYGVTLSTLWCGWSGRKVWNFYEGQLTLGLVPAYARFQRIADLKAGSDFAKLLGVNQIATHAGFLPEDPTTQIYQEVVCALREVAMYAKANGQYFLFETGQETPTTLRRVIQDIGLDNLGVNLDPANLILYGKANPVDAIDTIGEYVRDIHAKDGCYPTDGKSLGKETALGKGKVNFPALIGALKAIGYDGPITIEREISGEQQTVDILAAKEMLEALI